MSYPDMQLWRAYALTRHGGLVVKYYTSPTHLKRGLVGLRTYYGRNNVAAEKAHGSWLAEESF